MTFPRIWGLNPPQLHRAELGDEMGLAWGGRTLRTPVCWDGGGGHIPPPSKALLRFKAEREGNGERCRGRGGTAGHGAAP